MILYPYKQQIFAELLPVKAKVFAMLATLLCTLAHSSKSPGNNRYFVSLHDTRQLLL